MRSLPEPEHSPAPARRRMPEQTRLEVLEAAIAEFSEKGFSGGRVDEIAARMRTTKRMIYYYFGGKAQLYAAVLEHLYGRMRDAEQALQLDTLSSTEALRRLVEVTFDAGFPDAFGRPLPTAVTGSFMTSTTGVSGSDAGCD